MPARAWLGSPQPVRSQMAPASVVTPPIPRSGVPSHWTPISIGRGRDPMVELCKLDYDSYVGLCALKRPISFWRLCARVCECVSVSAPKLLFLNPCM